MDVTEGQLATALEGFYVRVRTVTGIAPTAQIADADDTARALYATLSRMAALREPGEAIDVHVHCEHVTGSLASSELHVMDQIVGLLRHHSERSRRRVLRWARNFLLDGDIPPF